MASLLARSNSSSTRTANNNRWSIISLTVVACCFYDRVAVTALSSSSPRLPIGRITSLDRSKLDLRPDGVFYRRPNLVTHTDDAFIKKLTDLYEDVLPKKNGDGRTGTTTILDLMSSHVSHLPTLDTDVRVDVHGMNADELAANPARSGTGGTAFVRNLNDAPDLAGREGPATAHYDAVLCCVGVQYLEEPERVFADVARILKPGTGVFVVSFTDRFFYEKALAGWIERGMAGRARLVSDYLRAAGGFENVRVVGDGTSVLSQLLSVGGVGGDPFVAVVATRDNSTS